MELFSIRIQRTFQLVSTLFVSIFILFIPLHSKFMNEYVTKTFNFKERLCNNRKL